MSLLHPFFRLKCIINRVALKNKNTENPLLLPAVIKGSGGDLQQVSEELLDWENVYVLYRVGYCWIAGIL